MEACEHHALSILNSLQSIVEADPSLCGLVSTLGLPYQDWYWVSLALTLLGKSGVGSLTTSSPGCSLSLSTNL